MSIANIIEIAQYRLCNGRIHGHVVIRSLEEIKLFLMALFAALTPPVFGRLFGCQGLIVKAFSLTCAFAVKKQYKGY
jgi:drug/metabolite transporter superfamily protein YnfA